MEQTQSLCSEASVCGTVRVVGGTGWRPTVNKPAAKILRVFSGGKKIRHSSVRWGVGLAGEAASRAGGAAGAGPGLPAPEAPVAVLRLLRGPELGQGQSLCWRREAQLRLQPWAGTCARMCVPARAYLRVHACAGVGRVKTD